MITLFLMLNKIIIKTERLVMKSTVIIENEKRLHISGNIKIICLDENMIIIKIDAGKINIEGRKLVTDFISCHELEITGVIKSVCFA